MDIAVLASGSGTNLQALIDTRDLGARLRLVLADRDGIGALRRAEAAGIPTTVVPWERYGARSQFTEAVGAALDSSGVEAVVLAGFMRILGPGLVDRYRHRILNIHPSLLPAFPGAHAVRRALEHGVKVTGVTVHFVDEEVDHGPIIAQKAVPVLPDDDEPSLHARIQAEEHHLYPQVVRAFAQDRLVVIRDKVVWR